MRGGSASRKGIAKKIDDDVCRFALTASSLGQSRSAFGSTLADKEVAVLVNFLTKQFGTDAAPMTEQGGQEAALEISDITWTALVQQLKLD